MDPFTQKAYKEGYVEDEEFEGLYQWLQGNLKLVDKDSKVYYHLQDELAYKMGKLWEDHPSNVEVHLSVKKTMDNS